MKSWSHMYDSNAFKRWMMNKGEISKTKDKPQQMIWYESGWSEGRFLSLFKKCIVNNYQNLSIKKVLCIIKTIQDYVYIHNVLGQCNPSVRITTLFLSPLMEPTIDSKVFVRNLLRGSRLSRDLNSSLTSKKPTHCLLDHGD